MSEVDAMSEAFSRGACTIDRMAVSLVRLPVRSRRSHGIGDVAGTTSHVILRLETSDGVVGWGEAAPWPVFAGTAEATMAALHTYLHPFVVGADPRDLSGIMASADLALAGHNDAKAALETALLDILGQYAGVPVWALLGGRCRETIPLSVSLADPDWETDRALIAQIMEDGVRLVKVKTGFAGHAFDVMRLEALRTDFPELDVRVDYNQGLDPFDALRKLRDIEVFAPTFIEQPVRADKTAIMAALTAALDVPLLADESVFTPSDAIKAVEDRIANGFSIKIMKSGGLRKGQTIARIAAAAGLGAYGGDMFETGIAHLAGTHMIAATPEIGLGCEFYQARYYLKEDLLEEPFRTGNGTVIVPDAPGLGAIVDEDRLRHYSIETRT